MINWMVIFLFVVILLFGIVMEKMGFVEILGMSIVEFGVCFGLMGVLVFVYLVIVLFFEIVLNNLMVVFMVLIVMMIVMLLGVELCFFVMVVVFGVLVSFLMLMGY